MKPVSQLLRDHWKRIFLRAHKDRRAARMLLILLVMAAAIITYVSLYGTFLFQNPFAIIMWGLALLLLWRIRVKAKRDNASFLSLAKHTPVITETDRQLAAQLARNALQLGLLLCRAGSEQYLKTNTLAQNKESIARRRILDTLTTAGLRDTLSPEELDLHLLPDGAWTSEQIAATFMQNARYDVLRFATGMDTRIPPVEDTYQLQSNYIQDVLEKHACYLAPHTLAPIAALQEAALEARTYAVRCLAEQIKRGTLTLRPDLHETAEEMRALAQSLEHNQHEDLLLGNKLVSEATESELLFAANQCELRADTLEAILTQLDAPS